MSVLTSGHPVTSRQATPSHGLHVDRAWLVSALIAIALLVVAFFTPLWQMTFTAPQYPAGLHITAYGDRLVGDLTEINGLNHALGVKPIDPENVTELKLFPFLLVGLIALVMAGAVFARGRLRLLPVLALWAFPVGFLIDLQWWLFRYGHDLARDAPLRFGTFTPKVIGETKIVNFHTTAMVSTGFFALVLAALVASFAPAIYRWYSEEPKTAGAVAGLFAIAGLLGFWPGHAAASAPQTSIAAAIAAAEPGAMVMIPSGTYRQQLTIDKPLTLVGEGWPVIVGGDGGDVITITADSVTLRGFVIEAAGRSLTDLVDEPAGLRVKGRGAVVEGNRFRNVLYGIVLQDGGGDTVRDNTISSARSLPVDRRGQGIYLFNAADNLVQGNTIDYVKDGIFISFSSGNRVENNRVSHGRYGIHYMNADDNTFVGNVLRDNIAGAVFMYAGRVTLSDNDFSYNRSAASGYGVLFKNVASLEMTGNRVHHNRLGVFMEGVPDPPTGKINVHGNLIAYNETGLELAADTEAVFTANSLVDNLTQVESQGGDLAGHEVWTVNGRGNYWSDYQGYDAAGDGVGDLPYRYTSVYADLSRDHASITAYRFTAAQSALELAARWFPIYPPQTLLVDRAPLMSKTVALPRAGAGRSLATVIPVAALLAGLPLFLFLRLRTLGRREWQRC